MKGKEEKSKVKKVLDKGDRLTLAELLSDADNILDDLQYVVGDDGYRMPVCPKTVYILLSGVRKLVKMAGKCIDVDLEEWDNERQGD